MADDKFPARIVLGEGWPDIVYAEPCLELYDEEGMPQIQPSKIPIGPDCPRYRLVLERVEG